VITFASSQMLVRQSRPLPAVSESERLDDLGEALDQLRRRLAVVGRPRREPKLPVEESEEAGVAELQPEAAAIEVREGDEEVGHRALLAAEEIQEAGGGLACGRHALRVARDFEPS